MVMGHTGIMVMDTGTARTTIPIATMDTEGTGRMDTGYTGITRIEVMGSASTHVAFTGITRTIAASIVIEWRSTMRLVAV
jgi:hypothetical protein